jgi:hypothetical protein
MSNVFVKDGIGYSQNAVFIMEGISGMSSSPDGKAATIAPIYNETDSAPWSLWGANNLLPNEMLDDLDNCSVLNSGIDTKARIAISKGIRPFKLINVDPATGEEQLEYVNDPEINDFMELNDDYGYALGITSDGLRFGMDHTQIILNKGRDKINRIIRTDVTTMRLEKADKASGIIKHTYLCSEWDKRGAYHTDFIKKIPLLQIGNEWASLQERNSGYEFAVVNRYLSNNKFYYSLPLWWAARLWVKIAREIPIMKAAAFKNQMSLKYIVSISSTYWNNNVPGYSTMSDIEKKAARDLKLNEIDLYLVGSDNAHKSIFATTYVDPYTQKEIKDIQIECLDDKMKDGKMLPDSAAADKQIMFAIEMNPALNGQNLLSDGASGGGGSGSDIREAYLVQVMLNEFERRKAAKVFNLVKRMNGWYGRYDAKGTPLIFRYPTNILTTLDTGKSTKPENT